MKKSSIILIFLISCFLSETALAQDKSIVKGRVFALPVNGVIWSFGLGYERVLSNKFSLQLMLNHIGTDSRQYDGPLDYFNNVIPELKYYFNPFERISSSFFISTFLEIQKRKYRSSGENDDIIINGNHKNPGLLLGKNMRLSQNMHFEMYIGIKYRTGSDQKV